MKHELGMLCCLASLTSLVLFIVGTASKDWLKDLPGNSGIWEQKPDKTPDKVKVVQAFSVLAILASASAVLACGVPLLPKQKLVPHTKEWAAGSSLAALVFGIVAVAVYADWYKSLPGAPKPEWGWSFTLMCVAVGLSAVPLLCLAMGKKY